MFGLFKSKEEKVQLKLLDEMNAAGHGYSDNPRTLRRFAHLVHILHGGTTALPVYERTLAIEPENRRSQMLAAGIRLSEGDADAIPLMEEVARVRPSLAVPCYRQMYDFYEQAGDRAAASETAGRLVEAYAAEEASALERRFDDPGGPLMPHSFDGRDLEFIRFWIERWLGGIAGVEALFAASRTLEDGSTQPVFWADTAPGSREDAILERLAELATIYGDFCLWANCEEKAWVREEIVTVPGSQIYP